MTTGQSPSSIGRAAILCALGVFFFSAMDAAMKIVSLALGAFSALLYRCVVASAITGVAMVATRNRWPPRAAMRLHLLRGLVLAPMAVLFFWSLTRLPIAEAIALSFIAPIIALYLSAAVLREHVSRNTLVAAVLGLVGVGVILSGRLGDRHEADAWLGAAAVLASAVLFGFNLIIQRQQALVAGAVEMSFFQNSIVLLLLLPLAPWWLTRNAAIDWPLVLATALLAIISQMTLSRAYAHAPASRLIPLEYSAFVWACLFGWLVFGERLTIHVMLGAALIILACLLAARERSDIAAHVETEAA